MARGAPAVVIWPNVARLFSAVAGCPHWNQLNALKASMRTSMFCESWILTTRVNERSRLREPTPRMLLRGCVLASVPAAGCLNASGLRKRLPPFSGLIESSPYGSSRICSARCVPACPLRAMSVPVDTVSHVFGYTVINDVSARDLQQQHLQFFKGKSLDTFCPMGPLVVTADEFGDPQNKAVKLRVNGVTKQNGHTRDMKNANFSIELIDSTGVWAFRFITLFGNDANWHPAASSRSVRNSSFVMPISTL